MHRVLVVDDNVDAAELTAVFLESLGYEVRMLHDGGGVLETVSSFEPRTVLLDVGLPVVDGYELARRLRARFGKQLRLVATTGYGQKSDRARGEEAGFDVYLVKPIDLDELARWIRDA